MVPVETRYSPTHEWCAVEGDIATVGVTKHALRSLGDLITIELPDVGDDVLDDVPFGEIEGMRDVKDLQSPVEGAVAEVNHRVVNNPDILEKDPIEQGWLVRIKVDPAALPAGLLSEADYATLVRSRGRR